MPTLPLLLSLALAAPTPPAASAVQVEVGQFVRGQFVPLLRGLPGEILVYRVQLTADRPYSKISFAVPLSTAFEYLGKLNAPSAQVRYQGQGAAVASLPAAQVRGLTFTYLNLPAGTYVSLFSVRVR